MLSAVINVAVSGVNTIVAGVTGRRIRVYGYVLTFSATTITAAWQDTGANNLTGPLQGTAAVVAPAVPPVVGSQPGWFTTTAQGQGLVLNMTGTGAIGGHILYDFCP